MNRKLVAVGIVAVWLGAVGWLVRREYFAPQSSLLAGTALNVAPGATYYRLDLGGQQVGFASSSVDTLLDAIRVQDAMLLRIPVLGRLERVEARTEALLSRALRLRRFRATLEGDRVRFAAVGEVHGDTLLQVEIESAESRQTIMLPLERPIVLPASMPLHLAFGGELQVGRSYAIELFDPMLLAQRTVDIRVVAESTFVVADSADLPDGTDTWIPARWDTVHAWLVSQRTGGLELEAWIDDLGQIVRATTPVGFQMERTAYEIAFENFRLRGDAELLAAAGDLVRQTAIASNVALPDAALGELRVRLSGVDLSGFDLAGDRQALEGDTLVVRREPREALRGGYALPNRRPELAPYLRPEPLIQSDDPRIQAQARQIIGRARYPTQAVERINAWVHDRLEKRVTLSVPSALEVLETRRGDCNEHTVLFVALARAAGVPARTAAGLVYLGGSFYYHAWPEVYLDGWVAVDPTFGQLPADAAHLRFTIGGLARQMELIRLIGRLNLEVVEAKTAT